MTEVQYITPEYLCKHVSATSLSAIASSNSISVSTLSKNEPKKSDYVAALSPAMELTGLNQLIMSIDLKNLRAVVDALDVQLGVIDKVANTKSKAVCQRRLKERVAADGAEKFFAAINDKDILRAFIETTGEQPISKKEEELVQQCINAAHYQGICNFLAQLNVSVLQDMMDEAGLKYNTDSKGKLIAALAGMHAAKKEKKEQKDQPVASKKKLPLKSSSELTFIDIHHHYNKEELVEFCEEKKLKVSGNKKEVIDRILIFLNGDDADKENHHIMAGDKAPAKKAAKGYAVPTKTFSSLGLGPKKSKKKSKKEGEESQEESETQKEKKTKKESSKKKEVQVETQDETQVESQDEEEVQVEKKKDKKKTSKDKKKVVEEETQVETQVEDEVQVEKKKDKKKSSKDKKKAKSSKKEEEDEEDDE